MLQSTVWSSKRKNSEGKKKKEKKKTEIAPSKARRDFGNIRGLIYWVSFKTQGH